MDKISSIISSSKNQVDMSKERPVRAGAPTYGQPVSQATRTFEKIQKEDEIVNPRLAVATAKISSPDVMRQAGIVDRITLSFKGNSEKEEPGVEQVIDLSALEISSPQEEQATEMPSLDLYA